METKGAIVIGGYVNGLGIVRALAARGVPAAVVTTKPYDIAHRSRWSCAQQDVTGLEERPEALIEALERWAGRFPGWALLPTNDEALAALSMHRERLATTYRVIAPPWPVTRQLVDKSLLMAVVREVGLDVPYSYGPALPETGARADLRFPVLVKPNVSHRFASRFNSKLFVARDRSELERSIAQLAAAGLAGEIFDLVPGADDQIYAYSTYVDAHGTAAPGVTIRKLRQSPPFFGVARVAEVVDEIPELREATLALLRRLDFQGIAAAEFKRDPRDGRMRFIEVNGRAVLYNALLRKAGLDVAGLAWSEHVAGRIEVAPRQEWRGIWINLHADLLYTALGRSAERVSFAEFVAPYARRSIEAVWSARDPRPFAAQWGRSARLGLRALWRGEHRALLAAHAPLGDPPRVSS